MRKPRYSKRVNFFGVILMLLEKIHENKWYFDQKSIVIMSTNRHLINVDIYRQRREFDSLF